MITTQLPQITSKLTSCFLVIFLWMSTVCAAEPQAPSLPSGGAGLSFRDDTAAVRDDSPVPLDNNVAPIKGLKSPFEAYDRPFLDHIVTTPWIRHFITGDLPPAAFQRFLGQDVLYLEDYGRASHTLALRFSAEDPRRAFFERYAKGAEEERLWELQQLKAVHYAVPHHKMAANGAYTHFLLDKAKNGTLPEAVAALIPCDTLWEELGQYIKHHVTDASHHPYKQWIVMYSDPNFERVAQAILDVEQGLLAQQPSLKPAAITAYKTAANFEVAFFQEVLEETLEE